MHQRSCRVIGGLNSELSADLELEKKDRLDSKNICELKTNDKAFMVDEQDFPVLKKGIKLPKCDSDLSKANEYFTFALQSNQPITLQDLASNIKLKYFAQNFGFSKSKPHDSLIIKYRGYTVKDWKKASKTLKSTNEEPDEIRYVSHILRDKIRHSNQSAEPCLDSRQSLNHDKYINKNF